MTQVMTGRPDFFRASRLPTATKVIDQSIPVTAHSLVHQTYALSVANGIFVVQWAPGQTCELGVFSNVYSSGTAFHGACCNVTPGRPLWVAVNAELALVEVNLSNGGGSNTMGILTIWSLLNVTLADVVPPSSFSTAQDVLSANDTPHLLDTLDTVSTFDVVSGMVTAAKDWSAVMRWGTAGPDVSNTLVTFDETVCSGLGGASAAFSVPVRAPGGSLFVQQTGGGSGIASSAVRMYRQSGS